MLSTSLRKALFAVAINKKSEKVQQRIQLQVKLTMAETVNDEFRLQSEHFDELDKAFEAAEDEEKDEELE